MLIQMKVFLCLDNSFRTAYGKVLHKYKLEKDIDLILTIKNDQLIETKQYILWRK